ncbi:MAG: hypothetical protein ACKVH8_20210 [Pirellulales bacterium]
MEFFVLSRHTPVPDTGNSQVYLKIDNWNDYGFVTAFHMTLHDENGQFHDIGGIKIGFKEQTIQIDTYGKLLDRFERVDEEFFSLGMGVDFYRKMSSLSKPFRDQTLIALRDIVLKPSIIEDIKEEKVFSTSLLRSSSLSVIKGQYARVLEGKAELTDYKFKYIRSEEEGWGGIDVSFDVEASSTPSTNIHAVFGRNGVGKTTLLNGMIKAISDQQTATENFLIRKAGKKKKFPNIILVVLSLFLSVLSIILLLLKNNLILPQGLVIFTLA